MPESLFLIKLQAEPYNFIKKETLLQVFSFEFCKTFKSTFFYITPSVVTSVSLNICLFFCIVFYRLGYAIYVGVLLIFGLQMYVFNLLQESKVTKTTKKNKIYANI